MGSFKFWNFIISELKKSKKIALLIVADSSNSSPGRKGFKMAVNENSETVGTIGGGIMENNMIEFALRLLSSGKNTEIKRLYHTNSTNHEKSGLICGGKQTIIFNILSINNLKTIEQIIENIKNRIAGKLIINQNEISYTNNSDTTKIEFNDDGINWEYKEQIGLSDTVYIVGGGHIGLAVSKIMKTLGFYVTVFDHRENVFTIEQNKFADEIIICKYDEIGNKIYQGDNCFVVVVTTMYTADAEALKSILGMQFKYIGLMGSKPKIEMIFDTLTSEGVDKKLFSKIHTPIGMEIEAETPEEIAISIAAEIIKVKNM